MNSDFQEQKKRQLSKRDKSNEGKWDDKIKRLCDKINRKKEYYTTSSCAGRIILIKGEVEKQKNVFLFKSHKKVGLRELKKAISGIDYKGVVEFKQSSCILHVACADLISAEKLVKKANMSGWKHSGIISMGKRVMVELHSTEHIDFPIIKNGLLLVDDNFLKVVLEESNMRLERVWGKIERLKRGI